LDLTVWVSWRWRGTVSNLQPEEHDAIVASGMVVY
jgi:hypothetical protein